MKNYYKVLILVILFSQFGCKTKPDKLEKTYEPFPKPIGVVSDYANLFSKIQIDSLTKIITDFEVKTTNQIAVISVNDIQPHTDFNKYAIDLSESWGIGQKNKDNGLSIVISKQLFTIPKGFKNNIIWNIAHILTTEQMLTYGLSRLELPVDTKFVQLYGKGSFPSGKISKEAVEEIKTQLIPAVKQTKIDYEKGVFKNFNEYKTSVGIELKSINDAIAFNNYHEGVHLGIILSIKKIV